MKRGTATLATFATFSCFVATVATAKMGGVRTATLQHPNTPPLGGGYVLQVLHYPL